MKFDFIWELIFPERCVCGKWDTLLCESCRNRIIEYKTTTCPICKRISKEGRICKFCKPKSALTGLLIFGKHETILKTLIWNYKYGFVKNLSIPLTNLLIDKFGQFATQKGFVVTYVPISKKRLRWRGFNQSELIARNFTEKTGLSVALLLKKNNTKPQVGLSRKERIKNLKGKFEALEKNTETKRVLIVDDVYTSGATLEECARALKSVGYREIWGMVLSRD